MSAKIHFQTVENFLTFCLLVVADYESHDYRCGREGGRRTEVLVPDRLTPRARHRRHGGKMEGTEITITKSVSRDLINLTRH